MPCFAVSHNDSGVVRPRRHEGCGSAPGTTVVAVEITAKFIAGMPKAELHVHLEGTLEPEMMLRTARSNGVDLPRKTVQEVRSAYRFGSVEAFLSVLFRVGQVLRRRQDFYDVTLAYLR